MRKHFNSAKRFLASIMVAIMSLMLMPPSSAFAAESSPQPSVEGDTLTLEEAGLTREEAISLLDLTEEEADNVSFYVIEDVVNPQSQTRSAIDVNNPYDSGYFSFTGTNTGSYRTMNGNHMKFRMLWSPNYVDGSEACQVYLYPYGSYAIWQYLFTQASPVYGSDSSYRDITSSWINITYGLDYHFTYWSYYGHGGGYCPDNRCTMRVLIAVA